MSTTFLNDVKFVTGEKITFTDEGLKHIKQYAKSFPAILKGTEFFITEVYSTKAEDELTELLSDTLGAVALKDVKTGEIFKIDPNDEEIWAFFTDSTPHYFNKIKGD